ncbi:MAG: SH3 domain-containing protein [Eubacteriales bacterium]|nr:SH3 domain-containing protein [Eubacteriales bacterium]
MKRLFVWLTVLMLLCGTASAEYTIQDAVLSSETGTVTLYSKPNGTQIAIAPASLWISYDYLENKGDWVYITLGGMDEIGVELNAYVKRSQLLDVDGLDLSRFEQEHPVQVPRAMMNVAADVFDNAEYKGNPIGRLEESLIVSVLAQTETSAFVQISNFIGFVDQSALTMTVVSGDLRLDTSGVHDAVVYCPEGQVVPIYGSCSEIGKPLQYVPSVHSGDTVQVLLEVDGYRQITYTLYGSVQYGGFIPERFFQPSTASEAETIVVHSSAPDKRVNLRDAANKNSNSIGLFCDGTPAQLLSDNGQWAYVRIGDLTGYMLDTYLSTNQTGADLQTVVANENLTLTRCDVFIGTAQPKTLEVEEGTQMSLLGFAHDSGSRQNQPYVRCGDSFGYVEFAKLRPLDDSHALCAKTTANTGFRDWPDKQWVLREQIPKNKQVTVLLHGENWSFARYGTSEGFISNKVLKFQGSFLLTVKKYIQENNGSNLKSSLPTCRNMQQR